MTVTIDPKYINVPNICFSLTEKSDSREKVFSEQRKTRGFDDSELWSLDASIAQFIEPRIRRFIEILHGHPSNLTFEEWKAILTEIADGFHFLGSDDKYACKPTDPRIKQSKRALKLFSEYFGDLWD